MKGSTRVIIGVFLVQAALAGVYWLVENRRSGDGPSEPLNTSPPVQVEGHIEGVSVRTFDGALVDLPSLERPTLIHFWATWCPPCRVELPGLLRLPDEQPFDVLAIALDRDWADVERFLGRRPSSRVLLGDAAEVEKRVGVRSLPVTYLVGPGGRLRLRFDGARDWTDPVFLTTWLVQPGGN